MEEEDAEAEGTRGEEEKADAFCKDPRCNPVNNNGLPTGEVWKQEQVHATTTTTTTKGKTLDQNHKKRPRKTKAKFQRPLTLVGRAEKDLRSPKTPGSPKLTERSEIELRPLLALPLRRCTCGAKRESCDATEPEGERSDFRGTRTATRSRKGRLRADTGRMAEAGRRLVLLCSESASELCC